MAIAAHFEQADETAGIPRERRRKLRLEAQGALASGARADVLVHNVSASGLLLETAVSLAEGEAITIQLPHAGATGAAVVWASGRLYGCRFDAPISAAALSAAQLRSAVDSEVEVAERTGESFGQRLQRLRKERGLALSDIAARLGVSKPTVWAWEQGKARPVAGRIGALADALGVSAAELQAGREATGLHELLARCRDQIAVAARTSPDRIRIMIEL